MPPWVKIAWRNVFRQKRRSLFTGLTLLSCASLLSFALSIGEGSYASIIEIITHAHTGDIQIHEETYLESPGLYKVISSYEARMKELLKKPFVSAVAPRIRAGGMAFVGEKVTGVKILGIDPVLEAATLAMKDRLKSGDYLQGPKDALLGYQAAKILQAKLGSEIFLLSQGLDGSVANEVYRVVGIVGKDSSDPDQRTVFLSLEAAKSFLSLRDVHELIIRLTDNAKNKALARDWNQKLSSHALKASPWQEVEKEFYRSMELDKEGNDYFMVIMITIVGLSVVNSVLMTTLERRREFGLMKALGTRPRDIFLAILAEVFFLGMFFLCLAFILSLGLNFYMAQWGIDLGFEMEIAGQVMDRMRGEVSFYTLGYPLMMVLTTAMAVTLWPALSAARIQPVEALRKH